MTLKNDENSPIVCSKTAKRWQQNTLLIDQNYLSDFYFSHQKLQLEHKQYNNKDKHDTIINNDTY